MTADPRVIAELRDLFRGGATPSRLVRHVVARHGEERQLDRLVRAYFREAFGVPMFRASADLLTLPAEELAFAGVNAAVIHQIVARRAEWDDSPVGTSWMDGLTATDEGQRLESAQRLTATAQHLHEQVANLTRLVEQRQGQVVALAKWWHAGEIRHTTSWRGRGMTTRGHSDAANHVDSRRSVCGGCPRVGVRPHSGDGLGRCV